MTNRAANLIASAGIALSALSGGAHAEPRNDRQDDPGLAEKFATHTTSGSAQKAPPRGANRFPQSATQRYPLRGLLAFCKSLSVEQAEAERNGNLDISRFPLRPECQPYPEWMPRSFPINLNMPEGFADPDMSENSANVYTLKAVQRYANKIKPETDQEIYKIEEYYTYPDEFGDCEDYVLLQHQILSFVGEYLRAQKLKGLPKLERIADLVNRGMKIGIITKAIEGMKEAGVNISILEKTTITQASLRIGNVYDSKGNLHAILIGKTHQNVDVALDHLNPHTIFWRNLPYSEPYAERRQNNKPYSINTGKSLLDIREP